MTSSKIKEWTISRPDMGEGYRMNEEGEMEHVVYVYRGDQPRIPIFAGKLNNARTTARLIAAAPDLLEALKSLYGETADYIRINNLGDVHQNRSMQLARSAIAKVEQENK